MRLAAGIVLALAAAAPAAAQDTVARGEVTAGPVIAGDGVAWADRTPSGAVRVLTMRRGGRPVVARRWAPAARRSSREVWAVAAGGGRGAAIVATCTHPRGYELSRCAPRAFAGPFARLRGPRLPQRVGRRCRKDVRNAYEVATGGGWTAVLVERFCPATGIESLAARRRIEATRGSQRRTIALGSGFGLRLAGRYLAWRTWAGGAELYDLRRGEPVRRLGTARGRIAGLDVQADGTLALTRLRANGEVCVATLALAGAERVVACRYERTGAQAQVGGGSGGGGPDGTVAISAGAVLYLRHDAELVLQRTGGEPRVVARFTPRRVRTGGFDLGPAGATWVQQRQRFPLHPDGMPRGPERIGRPQVVLRSL